MFVTPLAAAQDPDRFGAKAARLAQAGARGFSTPDGFCVAFDALDAVLSAGLGEESRAGLAAGVAPAARQDTTPSDARSEAASVCARAPLPPGLADELGEGVRRLGSGVTSRLAVRSSAATEDGAAHSFAGLFLTCLDVEPADVESAMRSVWASLWADTVVDYCSAFGLRTPHRMAVLVQPMVRARRLAIAHSIDSVAGRSDRAILDISRVGAAGDCYAVDRMSLEFLEVEPGDPAVGVQREELSAARDLARLLLAIERDGGFPVDVEAAHDGRAWVVLQVRPVTGLAMAVGA
jgi:phosphoenolpyruvate synthase/pyruvate phosphate dikinase